MKRDLMCLRCGVDMVHLGSKEFQLGQETRWVNTHRMEGNIAFELFGCPECGKVEAFSAHMDELIAQRRDVYSCPVCHAPYAMTKERCPRCFTEREDV